jgi:hypothetical protein
MWRTPQKRSVCRAVGIAPPKCRTNGPLENALAATAKRQRSLAKPMPRSGAPSLAKRFPTFNPLPEMPTEIPPATVADVLGTATATPEPAPCRTGPPFHVEQAEPAAPVDCDAKGVPFDPERHLPVKHPKTVVGCRAANRHPLPVRRHRRPTASSPAATAPDAPPPPDLSDIAAAAQAPEPPKAAGTDRFEANADVYCRAGIAGAMGLFGRVGAGR